MKTIGTIGIALLGITIAAGPALAGKKKSKKKAHAPAAEVEAPRRLNDELGAFGVKLATPTGIKKTIVIEEGATARADSFDLVLKRQSDTPSGDDAMRIQGTRLTAADAGDVVKGHADEIDYCWSRVPTAQRDTLNTSLQFTVDPRGTVLAISLGGDTPARFATCMKMAAKKWRFPIADGESVVEYPLALNAQ